MTIRPRSPSDASISPSEIAQGKDSLEGGLDASQDSILLKKIKSISTEALEIRELNALQHDPHIEESLTKDRDHTLMNNSDISLSKIRHIITERWIKSIYQEPNNGVLLFNYGRMHPLLTEDHAKGRGLNGRGCINELLEDIDLSHQYVCMHQEDLFHEAAKRDFQGKCIYQRLAKEYQYTNYTTLGKYEYLAGGYPGTLNTSFARKNFLKLIELYPNDDRNYALLGKLINHILMISERMDHRNRREVYNEIVFPLHMNRVEDLYLKAVRINPLNDEAYLGLGLLNHEQSKEKAKEFYLKALQLNPHNLEAAILLSEVVLDEARTVTFADGKSIKIRTLIENAFEYAPHQLAGVPYWYDMRDFLYTDLNEDCSPVIFRKFIASSSVEKHIKRNTLQSLMNSYDHSYGLEFEDAFANILFFLSQTPLADRDKDQKLIEYYFAPPFDDGEPAIAMLFMRIDSLKTHFPYDQERLKKLIPLCIKAICSQNSNFKIIYYFLATLISPNETVEIQGKKFTQEELYKEAAYGVYHDVSYTSNDHYTFDTAAKILGHYAMTLEDENNEEKQDHYNYKSFTLEDNPSFTKQNVYLKALSVGHYSAWPYFYLGKTLKKPLEVEGKWFNSSQELFLTALDIDPYHAESYHQLGNLLSLEEDITLLDGTVLSCQQMYTRSIQLGVQDPDAYFQAAKIMKKNQGVILFDDFTYLSKIDLLFRAFSMNETSSYYLKQIALYFQNTK
ncbi:MAG: tetratricopeptide repeat protein [Candidatus Rhabdochlamydia sp.]